MLVCTVGKTIMFYDVRCLDNLHAILRALGDWMELGSADDHKDTKPNIVGAWGRAPDNPIVGWNGLKKSLRGRFAMYVPPAIEHLGLAEFKQNPRGNRMRAR